MKLLAVALLLFTTIPALNCMPVSLSGQSGGLFILPDNVESLASFIDSSATIEPRAISFGPGTANGEKLLEVPLGFIEPHATIRITVGLDDTRPSAPTVDHDLAIGISDGTYINEFWILDVSNYGSFPCRPASGTHDNNQVTERTHAPAQITLTFKPLRRYGACYLPLDGGYMNTGTFNAQLDLDRGMSLTLRRDGSTEQYRIYYFLVEIFQ